MNITLLLISGLLLSCQKAIDNSSSVKGGISTNDVTQNNVAWDATLQTQLLKIKNNEDNPPKDKGTLLGETNEFLIKIIDNYPNNSNNYKYDESIKILHFMVLQYLTHSGNNEPNYIQAVIDLVNNMADNVDVDLNGNKFFGEKYEKLPHFYNSELVFDNSKLAFPKNIPNNKLIAELKNYKKEIFPFLGQKTFEYDITTNRYYLKKGPLVFDKNNLKGMLETTLTKRTTELTYEQNQKATRNYDTSKSGTKIINKIAGAVGLTDFDLSQASFNITVDSNYGVGKPITKYETNGNFHKDPFIFPLGIGHQFYLIWGDLCTLYYKKYDIDKNKKIVELANDTDNNVLLTCGADRNIWAPSLYHKDGKFYLYYSEGQTLGADKDKDLTVSAIAWQSYNIYYKTIDSANRTFTNDILSKFSNTQHTQIFPLNQEFHGFPGASKLQENGRYTYGVIDQAIADGYMYYVVVPYWLKNSKNETIRPHGEFIRRSRLKENSYTELANPHNNGTGDGDQSACNEVNGLTVCDAVISEYDGVAEAPAVVPEANLMAISVRPTDSSQQIYVLHGREGSLFKSNGTIYLYNPNINEEKYEMSQEELNKITTSKNKYNIGGQDMALVGNDIVMAFQAKVREQKYKWDLFLQVIYSSP